MRTKRFRIVAFVITLLMVLTPLTSTACSLFGPSENDIEIVRRYLSHYYYGQLTFYVKIKNKSSDYITVSFYGKIYLDGEIIAEGISSLSTLAPGESATLKGPSMAEPLEFDKNITHYKCKITKWNFY